MPMTQKHIVALHRILQGYAATPQLGADTKAELELVCEDLQGYCLDEKWDALPQIYRAAWQGELHRRLALIIPSPKIVLLHGSAGTKTQADVLGAVADGAASIRQMVFSQYTVNRHFQGNYVGQPPWLSDLEIHDAARILRAKPELSSSLRIRVHCLAGQWMCLNNRGFALHCLANLVPRRLVFDTELKGEENGRANVQRKNIKLNFKDSVPASRRGKDILDETIPTRVTAVPKQKNDGEVIYTVKAISMEPDAAPDHGNETVFNVPNFPK